MKTSILNRWQITLSEQSPDPVVVQRFRPKNDGYATLNLGYSQSEFSTFNTITLQTL